MPLVTVQLVELIKQCVVLVNKFLDIFDQLVLILRNIDRSRRAYRCRLLERIGDTVHRQVVLLEIGVVASVNLNVCVGPRSRHGDGCRTARRKRHGRADGAVADNAEVHVVQEGRRIARGAGCRIHGEVNLVVGARLTVGEGKPVGYRVIVCTDVK